ncbi:MAG: ABC transporter permease [Rhodobacteraceae bacterium]|nr:ABC transporter permease [Paracoccaceae bacterium]
MTATADPQFEKKASKERYFSFVSKADSYFKILGLSWVTPVLKIAGGDNLKTNGKEIWRLLCVPLLAIMLFLGAWGYMAPKVQTSLGAVPGPVQVWEQFQNLSDIHQRQKDKEAAFYQRQDDRNATLIAQGKDDKVKFRKFTGAPTYYDQIWTSLITVFFGFLLATIIAVPLGIAGGLSPMISAGLNPIIQIFKPVSPLAWLPIVTMVVSATVTSAEPLLAKSFLVSAITVTLCSLWPTLINTTLGVASIDKELISVSKVLKLNTWTKITKLVLPSALPLIFTGLRLSLGVGWMVLIAAEMLAQNPGLGKFVWDEFQNGSSQSLAKIMAAVLTIGLIGYLLDRVMFALQSIFTFSADR